ncbi:nucleoside-diphosphate sugar epimerase/dehydratase [Mesorhizobium sp. CAU 1732]|uniref:polysaccharide biosynthesis protein n=1 Tax=Mesorhizobium sp. CAU 1732 TaxID=3140358 RepID=UPI003260E2C6
MTKFPVVPSLSRLRDQISAGGRAPKRLALIIFDATALTFVCWLSFTLRLGHTFVPNAGQTAIILAAPALAIPIFARMGLYRAVLRYLPDRAVWTIVQVVSLAVLGWVALAFLTAMTGAPGVPRSVPAIYWMLSLLVITGSRFGAKWLLWRNPWRTDERVKTLIYGTGDAATQLADALRSSGGRDVAGFISKDASLYGLDMMGIRVYPPAELRRLVTNIGIDEIIITTPSVGGASGRALMAELSSLPVNVRILPPIADLAEGKYLVSHVRDIDIDDLLGRSPVPADPALLRAMIHGRSILVTGAAGSIGSALCRIIARLQPARLVLLETNEHGLYQIDRELRQDAAFPIVPVLGSIGDSRLVQRLLAGNAVETIYHCAAYKHVHLVEANSLEGIRNNVLGTQVLAEAAVEARVPNFILISSDKAVRPASVMGATKRWAEKIVRFHGTKPLADPFTRNYACVRFGNVIGSSGSVVPLFKEQIASGGPVTITDEKMTRYFMSVREAAELIVQAGGLSQSGDILLLEMGEPISIRDLAQDMVALAGLTVRDARHPEGDIEIVTIGMREGEKLHEELFYDPTGVSATAHPKILRAKRQNGGHSSVPDMMADLRAAMDAMDSDATVNVLFKHTEQ